MKEVFEKALTERIKALKIREKEPSAEALIRSVTAALIEVIKTLPTRSSDSKRAAYFSAEFLPGNLVGQTLSALDLEDACSKVLNTQGLDISDIYALPDPALGNGGLGRLAACLLDSAAAIDIPLDGYGIRYRFGLFRQEIKDNGQRECPDIWQYASTLEKERRELSQLVSFGDGDVIAVPFDLPIVGRNRVNKLRLFEARPVSPVDFEGFKSCDIDRAFRDSNNAAAISAFLYPPDETEKGKQLRLKQQYFFVSAALGSILKDFKFTGKPILELSDFIKIQLNDTHPTVAIPELIRRLTEDYNISFEDAFYLAENIFSYTNHTVMAEALEKWDISLFSRILPKVYPYVVMINNRLSAECKTRELFDKIAIIKDNKISMANMAVYVANRVNGVAKIHSDIIKTSVFKDFAAVYPDKFTGITNGISHRRWLLSANKELTRYIDHRLGDGWHRDLLKLSDLKNHITDTDALEFMAVKKEKKIELSNYLKSVGISLDPNFMFSIQIKRIHEYKRQLLNILGVLGLYIDLKSGELKDFHPTAFIFAGKAAPGYFMAKEVIRLINSVCDLIKKDETARKYISVIFLPDYNVKNAMKLIPAADLSEQLSTAGTEASGTGNMKLSLNGAPTVGTLDGATIEIVEKAGRENNYIFGATKEDLEGFYDYDPMNIYYTNNKISRVVDLLKDGPAGNFEELFKSLLFGYNGEADKYKVLMDYPSYFEARCNANRDYKDKTLYGKKGIMNTAAAGDFSSDRTVAEYNSKIWLV